MFCINVLLTVKEVENVPTVRDCLAEIVKQTVGVEEGCLRLEVYQSQTEERKFLLCEHWKAKAAREGHREEPPFIEIYLEKVLPLVDREPHISDLVAS